MNVRIAGVNLPGRNWSCYENIHVGIQRRSEVVDLVPGDAGEATWEFEVAVTGDGDFRGPYVQGRRPDRFVYLSWGTVDANGTFAMFRRAKLMLGAIDTDVVGAADAAGYTLQATLALTGAGGAPRCAAVRPPAISWSAVPTLNR